MTCIAWDGRTLAADRRLCVSGGIHRTVTKIWFRDGCLLGLTGATDTALEMREWWASGNGAETFPVKAREDVATLIVISRERIEQYCGGPVPVILDADQCAWGSGRDFAEAAMYLGKGAVEAVDIACHFQTDCGNGVDWLMLP